MDGIKDFLNNIELTDFITTLALIISLFSWWETRKTRISGESKIKISRDYEAFNSKGLD